MAKDLNMCQFIGRLGRDVETRYMPNGDAVCNFSIACSDDYTKDNNKVEQTEWINVVGYRKLAEIMDKYLKKGSQVYIQGKMQTRSWEKEGVKRYSTEIIANQMQMLGGRDEASTGSSQQEAAKFTEQNMDETIPF